MVDFMSAQEPLGLPGSCAACDIPGQMSTECSPLTQLLSGFGEKCPNVLP